MKQFFLTMLGQITGDPYLWYRGKGKKPLGAQIAVLRDQLPRTKRWAILKRDHFICQLCGRGKPQGVFLHVDHKIPLAGGGTNAESNLWTLCEDCNLGKGVDLYVQTR